MGLHPGTDGILRFRNTNDAANSSLNWLEVERNGVNTQEIRVKAGSGSEVVSVTDGNVTITGDLVTTGNVSIAGTITYEDATSIDSIGIVTARSGIDVPDSQKIALGDGGDLEIYHTGSNSVIQDVGTGDLILGGSTEVSIRKFGLSENMGRI